MNERHAPTARRHFGDPALANYPPPCKPNEIVALELLPGNLRALVRQGERGYHTVTIGEHVAVYGSFDEAIQGIEAARVAMAEAARGGTR